MRREWFLFMVSLLPGAVLAGHAGSDWPEPVKEYYTGSVLFDRLEVARTENDDNRAVWDMLGWWGGDSHRLVFKSEGENTQNDGEPTDLESAELLYGYRLTPYWSLQAGLGTRGELSSDADLENYAVVSFMGLAPYWFEMDNSLVLNEEGDLQFIGEAEYDVQLSQASYLQPRMELTANLNESEEYERPSGFSNLRLGLRYRHEIIREFAPYIGVFWDRALGNTADQLSDRGDDTDEAGMVIGARLWF
ncbi:copper resistance protein B [Marinobacteraceae bacterium S3BR75-40.1]